MRVDVCLSTHVPQRVNAVISLLGPTMAFVKEPESSGHDITVLTFQGHDRLAQTKVVP